MDHVMQAASAIHCRFYFMHLTKHLNKEITHFIFFQGGVAYQGGTKKGGCLGVNILFIKLLVLIEL